MVPVTPDDNQDNLAIIQVRQTLNDRDCRIS